jgi:hypothetical protein
MYLEFTLAVFYAITLVLAETGWARYTLGDFTKTHLVTLDAGNEQFIETAMKGFITEKHSNFVPRNFNLRRF